MIENHVTSLELSKQLKELGVKQESEFRWFPFDKGVRGWQIVRLDYSELKGWRYYRKNNKDFDFYSAFLSSELGELLKNNGVTCNWQYDTDGTWKWTAYQPSRLNSSFNDETECNARAKMLIYLIQQRLAKGGRA